MPFHRPYRGFPHFSFMSGGWQSPRRPNLANASGVNLVMVSRRFVAARTVSKIGGTRRINQGDKTVEDRIVRTMKDAADDVAWREQCRYQLERDVATRIKYGFCHVYKPVLDDAPVRTFATMAEYRRWCDRELPAYLGYRLASRDR